MVAIIIFSLTVLSFVIVWCFTMWCEYKLKKEFIEKGIEAAFLAEKEKEKENGTADVD